VTILKGRLSVFDSNPKLRGVIVMIRLISVCVLLLSTRPSLAGNWPAWRGVDGSGISDEKNLPEEWSATQNIKWKLALPESCNSTPIVWEDRVFLTQGIEGGTQRAIIGVDRKSGKSLWQESVACATKETTHRQNPPCSASPITDGKAVYANFASGGILACTLDGKKLWHRDLGPVLSRWGNGGSPVLYGDLLIVFHGPGTPSILYALNKNTGETVWKTNETAINSPIFGSWSTPIVVHVDGHDELIMPLPGDKIKSAGYFKGYSLKTGQQLWQVDGLGNEIYAMPITNSKGNIIVGISGHNGPTMAIRPGGSGNATKSHLLWRTEKKNPQRVGSGVIHDGRLFLADATGILQCLNAETGELIYRERLGGNLWGSILLADGKLYVSNLEGDTYVIDAGTEFKLLAKNSTGEATYAGLAASNGQLFLRTHKHLYCIEKAQE
jgi:outer membrane protein assembly factor BamB